MSLHHEDTKGSKVFQFKSVFVCFVPSWLM